MPGWEHPTALPGRTVTVGAGQDPRGHSGLAQILPGQGPLAPEAEGGLMSRGSPLFCLPPEPGLPTCLVCVCPGSSVYCDNADLESVPRRPRTTTHLDASVSRPQASKGRVCTALAGEEREPGRGCSLLPPRHVNSHQTQSPLPAAHTHTLAFPVRFVFPALEWINPRSLCSDSQQ